MFICQRCRTTTAEDTRVCSRCGGRLVDQPSWQRVGTTIGNYRLLDVIGRGGMGTVFRGEHVYIGRPVAVKVLHAQFAKYEEAVKRFLREARAASAINHPNIVDVTDFGPTNDGGVYFVMEYIEGESLEDLIAREAPIVLHRAINIVNQLASALGSAHKQGVIHRDLKPENIMLASRPGRRDLIRFVDVDEEQKKFVIERESFYDFVKILDFGIAKVLESPDFHIATGPAAGAGQTIAGAVFGTPEYMSPESAQGLPVDHRSDIYSLGVIFYDMLVGHVPFEAQDAQIVMKKHISDAPVPPRKARPEAEITEAADKLILKCLAKKPADRQQTMDEMREELRGCFGSMVYKRDAERYGLDPNRLQKDLSNWMQQNGVQPPRSRRTVPGAGVSSPPPATPVPPGTPPKKS